MDADCDGRCLGKEDEACKRLRIRFHAKGVSRLYRPRVSAWALMVLVLAAGATILVAVAVTPAGQVLLSYLSAQWDAAKYWLTGLL